MWNLDFISEQDFKNHIINTIKEYGDVLKSIDLQKFNSNIIDPIKLIFDKNIYKKDYETLIKDEILRQRDKSNNNIIGYFHQKIFKYIKNCKVPENGFDIIFDDRIFVEMKNKHNTMNSSSSAKTMINMQNKILENSNFQCFLVEVIAKKSQDIEWKVSVDKKQISNPRIRRVSIDQFYKIVTGDDFAFFKICEKLPSVIYEIVQDYNLCVQKDSVIDELIKNNTDIQKALFSLTFSSYLGFKKLKDK